jgi:hypothetical protein
MKNKLSLFIAVIAWFAVLAQYYLMIENRVSSMTETTIRFFSFFTILTNSLVAVYFTATVLDIKKGVLALKDKPGTLTAVTVYITVVGLVYQIVLRHIWEPTGLQMVVDELLHSFIPVMVVLYWYLHEHKSSIHYGQIATWLWYPLAYLVFVLVRGSVSNFYPYPFIHVGELGLSKVLTNSVLLTVFFAVLSAAFVTMGKWQESKSAK